MRKFEPANTTRDIPHRIRPSISVRMGIRKLSDSDAIEDHEYQLMILQ